MVDGHNPLTGAHLGRNHHPTGLILRNNTWHTSEHGLGRASKDNYHLTNKNKLTKGRQSLLWLRETGIITQRGGKPLHTVRVRHGILSGQSVPGKIMIIGKWARSAFLRYIRIQVSDLGKGIRTLMTNNHAFYTIPEIEVVYHTPGRDDTYPQRLRLNRRGW